MNLWNRLGRLAGREKGGESDERSSAGSEGASSSEERARRERVVRAYHQQSKHGFHRPAAGPHELDWANQPDPFRRYVGAPCLALERPTEPGPSFGEALGARPLAPRPADAAAFARLFYDSLAISAWKEAGGTRWALRTNPSSGNLHPTEAYVLAPAIDGLTESPGVLHYAPREHALESLAELSSEVWEAIEGRVARACEAEPAVRGARESAAASRPLAYLVLTSIHWREAWKYGERAWRYCQHDCGHAIAALAVAAAGLGWRLERVDSIEREELARWIGVDRQAGPEAECVDCLLVLRPAPRGSEVQVASERERADDEAIDGDRDTAGEHEAHGARAEGLDRRALDAIEWRGAPNDLSAEHVEWDAIEIVSQATAGVPFGARAERSIPAAGSSDGSTSNELRDLIGGPDPVLRELVRSRRSAVAFDGRTSLSRAAFEALLRGTLPSARPVPFASIPGPARVHLALFVHRVDDLHPGLYWLQRDGAPPDALRAAMRDEFLWETPDGCARDLPLSLLLPMKLTSQAISISCTQEIAGNGAFSLGMLAEFDAALAADGPPAYPRLYWECGAIGQMLYLESERHERRATGIGCFFDDAMHQVLGLRDTRLQSLYHLAGGTPVDDVRLTTLPAYPAPDGA